MKRVFLSLFAILAFTTVTMAQGFHVGAKAGANLGKIQGQGFKDGFKLGYQLGGFMEIDFTKGIGIQPEILWSQTNTTVTDEVLTGLHGDIHLDYLSIPVLLRLNPSKLVTINLGPQFSVLTDNHKTTLENAGNAFKSGDFAMVGGAQLNLGALRIYGRYVAGLNHINANTITNSDKWRHQQIQMGLGLKLF